MILLFDFMWKLFEYFVATIMLWFTDVLIWDFVSSKPILLLSNLNKCIEKKPTNIKGEQPLMKINARICSV